MKPAATRMLRPEPTHAVLSEAAEWYARLRDGSASSHEVARWQAWLHAAEEHQTAWHYVEDISRGIDPLRSTSDPRRTADALSTAHERLHARRRILMTLAAIASGGTLGMLSWRETMLSSSLLAWTADHRTPTGAQRAITLADGTHLWLNTASAINLHFNTSERRIELVQGEIFIETSRDKTRPFLVETSHGRMQALGTRFNVRLNQAQTQLDVYEGAVEIRTASSGISRVVGAGQQSSFDRADIAALMTADAAREAWTQGMLLADNIPLHQVVQELRRYRAGHLGLADDVGTLKVYGNFPLHDTDRALRMLASALPIRIEQPLPWWTTLEAAR
jgi:transmembrane sensor